MNGLLLSFDDHFIKPWFAWRRWFEQHKVFATFFLSNLHELTNDHWEMLKAMESDGHEIGLHTTNHTRAGVPRGGQEWRAFFQEEILNGLSLMEEKGLRCPNHFSYPWGNHSTLSDGVLCQHFKSLRIGGRGIYEKLPQIWGALNFGKAAKEPFCGHEPLVLTARERIVCFFMHLPIEHRLEFLAAQAQKHHIPFLRLGELI